MTEHPYKTAPARAFWSRSVAEAFDPRALPAVSDLVRAGEKVASAGSCFAANIVPYLEKAGIAYVRTEVPPPNYAGVYEEGFSYHRFSAAYGNIYTPRQFHQLIERALGRFHPAEDRWHQGGYVIDPYRPGLKFPATTDVEFDALTAQHLGCVRRVFEEADVFVFTLGLTEAWESSIDGAVFPSCPGTVAGSFDPERHRFHNFTAAETIADMTAAIRAIREINPRLRVILTVSPVPLVATATQGHVLTSTIYSKSVLRVAAEEVSRGEPDVAYFPAYEIVTGPQAPYEFFEASRRDVSRIAIDTVMASFLGNCAIPDREAHSVLPDLAALARQPAATEAAPKPSGREGEEKGEDGAAPAAGGTLARLSEIVANFECEEAAVQSFERED